MWTIRSVSSLSAFSPSEVPTEDDLEGNCSTCVVLVCYLGNDVKVELELELELGSLELDRRMNGNELRSPHSSQHAKGLARE